MKQADEKRITVRYTTIDEQVIELVKKMTDNNTASKAMLAVIHKYPGMVDTINHQAARIKELQHELGYCRRVFQNYTQSLNQLHGLADKLVNGG